MGAPQKVPIHAQGHVSTVIGTLPRIATLRSHVAATRHSNCLRERFKSKSLVCRCADSLQSRDRRLGKLDDGLVIGVQARHCRVH